jgi:hypothetical protein
MKMRRDTVLTTTDTEAQTKTCPGDLVPRHRTLDGFIAAVSQADGIDLIEVDALSTLVVRTNNSVYRITILTPHTREVLVQGGRFFPERTRACLNGSSFGGSCLKLGWVGLGLHLEFHVGDQWVITSQVRTISLEPFETGPPC